MNLAEIQSLLRQTGWPDVVVDSRSGRAPLIALMASIGLAESSGNPNAHNPRGEDSVGIFQINRRAHHGHSVAQLKDPVYNAQVALQVYQMQGLRAWGAYTDGRYRSDGQFNQSLALYGGSVPDYYDSGEPVGEIAETIVINSEPAYGSYEEYQAATGGGTSTLLWIALAVVGILVVDSLVNG